MHRLTAFMSANPESPLQTTYEGRGFGGGHPVLDQYLSQADKLVAATKSGGVTMPSTTRDIAEGQTRADNPKARYVVSRVARGQVYYKGTDGKGSFKMDRENWDENYS